MKRILNVVEYNKASLWTRFANNFIDLIIHIYYQLSHRYFFQFPL